MMIASKRSLSRNSDISLLLQMSCLRPLSSLSIALPTDELFCTILEGNQVFFDCVTKNKIQHPIITEAMIPNIACVFHPLCTNAAFRLYFFTVKTYSEKPLARQARLMHQKTIPKGKAMSRSRWVGVEER